MFGEFAFGESFFGDAGVYGVISGPDVLYVSVASSWPAAGVAGPFPSATVTAGGAWPAGLVTMTSPDVEVDGSWPRVLVESW